MYEVLKSIINFFMYFSLILSHQYKCCIIVQFNSVSVKKGVIILTFVVRIVR